MRGHRRIAGCFSGFFFLCAAGCGTESQAPSDAAGPSEVDASTGSTASPRPAQTPRVAVLAADRHRDVPTLLRVTNRQAASAGASVESAARAHLGRYSTRYRTTPSDLAQASVRFVNDQGRGPILVAFRQYRDGVEVLGSDVKVLMRRNLDLVAIGGTPRAVGRIQGSFVQGPRDVLVTALRHQRGLASSVGDWDAQGDGPGGYSRFLLRSGGSLSGGGVRLVEPARVKAAYFPRGEVLVPAYVAEVITSLTGERSHLAHRYVVSGVDGEVLSSQDLQTSAHSYRVWAEPAGTLTPQDGPQGDFTPHPTGVPDGTLPTFTAAGLVTVEGLNTGPLGSPDAWLPSNATVTTGNNVDAYADQSAPDGYSSGDVRASTTSAGVFDHPYDTAAEPMSSSSQVMAAVTQLFYTTNWLHDWYYDSGFDEAAGNAQTDNFGRGGLPGDPLLAEAQDGALPPTSNRDNANMTTPADGSSPRLQMYLWSAPERRLVELDPGGVVAAESGEFGPQQFDVTGTVALADDGVAPTSDACEAFVGDVAGRIALVRRGTCTFVTKVQNAQDAGAIGVIVANDVSGGPPAMGGTSTTITIPTLSIGMDDGDDLQSSLSSSTVGGRLLRVTGVERSGSLDGSIVAHEWGHYLHMRLAPCGTDMCGAMSEGWADFVALHMMLRENDDLDGAFPMGVYAAEALSPDAYFGLRRAPYSRSFDINALTFRHVSDGEALPTQAPLWPNASPNSELHNAGEIWATMLFHAYGALVEQTRLPAAPRSFEQVRRLMSDYVVLGLQLAPPEPTFLEMRDALLTAAAANEVSDSVTLAAAFAERGAGTCAVSAPRDSTNFAGVVESYALSPRIELGPIGLRDAPGCGSDEDGVLDRGEQGWVTVELTNAGPAEATDVQVEVTSAPPVLTFPVGPSVQVGSIAGFATRSVEVPVAMDAATTGVQTLTLEISAAAPQACESPLTGGNTLRANTDEVAASSATDDVESAESLWSPEGSDAQLIWSRSTLDATDFFWHGLDYSAPSDTALVSPPLPVSATSSLVVSFWHRHQFEQSDGEDWDGGVVEISRDDGAHWEDVSNYVDPGYAGPLSTLASNPLGGRPAYVGTSSDWPDYEQVNLDFGTSMAAETVRLRFRIGTDEAVSDYGWELDDIAFSGIETTPFGQVLEDAGDVCAGAGGQGGAAGGSGEPTGGVAGVLGGTGGSATPGGNAGAAGLPGAAGQPGRLEAAGSAGWFGIAGDGGSLRGGSPPSAGAAGETSPSASSGSGGEGARAGATGSGGAPPSAAGSAAQEAGGPGIEAAGHGGERASPGASGDAGSEGSVDDAGAAGAGTESSSSDSGCGCTMPGRRGSSVGSMLALVAVLLVPRVRRRASRIRG